MSRVVERDILNYLGFQGSEWLRAPYWTESDAAGWKRILNFTDRAGLTIHLRGRLQHRNHYDALPTPVQNRLEGNLESNRTRTGVLIQEFLQINRHLQAAGIRYVNLKGLLLSPRFIERPEYRVQYDFDLLVGDEDKITTYNSLQELGYNPAHRRESQRADHLPPLIKKTGWEWHGDYFDPKIPPGVEVHYQLWDPKFERIPVLLFDDAWEKTSLLEYQSFKVPVLSPNHELLYLTLHCCRHLLRSDLRLSHIFELAYFVNHNSGNREFWDRFLVWLSQCPNSSRMVATSIALAVKLFQPETSVLLRRWIHENLKPAADRWIESFGARDAPHGYRKNKNVLFLHLSLLDRKVDQWGILQKRVLPRQLPLAVAGIYLPDEENGPFLRGYHFLLYFGYLAGRTFFHVVSLFWLCLHLPAWLWFLRHPSKSEFQRQRNGPHLAGRNQLSVKADKFITGVGDSQIDDIESVQKVGTE